MFGHQNDDHHDDNQEPQHDGILEHGQASDNNDQHNPALPTDLNNFGAGDDTAQGGGNQGNDDQDNDAPAKDSPAEDTMGDDTVTPAVSGGHPLSTHDDLLDSAPANDLLDIKLQALKQLTPLVDHLDQSPEEKFRTTMMMIQASDDQSLVKVAYDAAQAITDEKARAQALLDIVNEINYFTHQDNGSS